MYYTYAKNVAIRLTNVKSGEYYSRYWKSRQFAADDWHSDGTYVYIPARAFSDAPVELFKRTEPTAARIAQTITYDRSGQPSGYLAFQGET